MSQKRLALGVLTRSVNDGRDLGSTGPLNQIMAWGSEGFLGERGWSCLGFGLGGGGGGADCLMASVNVLREVVLSLLRSSKPFSVAATMGVMLRGLGGWGWVDP